MINYCNRYIKIALLSMGSAILLFSCNDTVVFNESYDEMLMTEYSDSLEIIMSKNGIISYRFRAAQMEGYSLAKEPYQEFRKGVKIITYEGDSLPIVDVTLTSNYAIYYTDLELWEAKGNVVVIKSDGNELYTEQLFWDSRTKRIYSNVDSKIIRKGSEDTSLVEGFESDEKFELPQFRRIKSLMRVNIAPSEGNDSLSNNNPNASSAKAKPKRKTTEPTVLNRNNSRGGDSERRTLDGAHTINSSLRQNSLQKEEELKMIRNTSLTP